MAERIERVDIVRRAALDRIDRSERTFKLLLAAVFVIEAVFLGSFVLLADFTNRTHVLLLIASIAIYLMLGLGLFALGAHVDRNTKLVLKAIGIERGGGDSL